VFKNLNLNNEVPPGGHGPASDCSFLLVVVVEDRPPMMRLLRIRVGCEKGGGLAEGFMTNGAEPEVEVEGRSSFLLSSNSIASVDRHRHIRHR